MRRTTLVNQRRSARRADKVDEMSRGTCETASMHLLSTSGAHLFELERSLRPLMKLPCSPSRTIQAFSRLAGKWWLHLPNDQRQRRQCFGAMRVIGALLAVVASISRSCSCTSEARSSDAPVWGCSWRRAAQLAAARMRTVRTVSAWLEALSLRTPRHRHAAIECA